MKLANSIYNCVNSQLFTDIYLITYTQRERQQNYASFKTYSI